MGIHTGKAQISESGYTGIDIHRTQRIMSYGYGGQVLISEAAKVLIENELSPNVKVKYLGEHYLKDLSNPEKIYQLVIEGLRSDFPRQQSLSPVKTNLPSDIVNLIGREKELETLNEIMSGEDTRLVTITGPGGMGKTSLGLNVCRLMQNSFSDGVFFVSLSAITEAELVLSSISKALGLSESSDRDFLINFLNDKNILLFLDNFEQVIEAAGIIKELLSSCLKIKILISSRILLRINAEKEFPLDSLPMPSLKEAYSLEKLSQFAAIRLFIERAKNIDRNFRISDENADAIKEICIQLDGLPLAIELACARIKLFTPKMLLSRLGRTLDILKGMNKDLPERHQTLRQTIAWSYELLSEQEKKLFEIVSVFAGSFTLEAIENVGEKSFDKEYELIDSVGGLLDKSLLRRIDTDADDARFNMLFTIREFSKELFTQSENYKNIRDRHARYYLMNAEEAEPYLTGKDIKYWSDILDKDIDNYRAAITWSEKSNNTEIALRLCGSLWRFFLIRKNLKEGYEKMKYVLTMPYEDSQKMLRARVLNGLGTIAHELNNYEMAAPLVEESLSIYRELEDRQGELYSLINLFWIKIQLGELDVAEELEKKCLQMNETLKEDRAYGLIYNNIGWMNFMRGNLEEARNNFLKGLSKRIEAGDKRGEGFLCTNMGWIEIVMGNYESAEEYLERAVGINSALSDKHLMSWALSNLALLELYRGNFKKAEGLVKESIHKIKESVNEWGISYEILLYGIILYQLNEKQMGIEKILKGLSFYKKIKSKWGTRRALLNLGMVYLDMGELEKSIDYLKEALEICVYLKDKVGLAEIFEIAALIFLKNDNPKEAKRFYEAAVSIREEIEAPMNFVALSTHKENLKKLDVKKIKKFDLESLIQSVNALTETG